MVRRIPFESPDFTWEGLEEFMVDFLNAGVSLPVDGPAGVEEKRILSAVPYDKRGGKQKGVDIRAEVEGGEVWAFQCKLETHGQRNRWTLAKSKVAVAETSYAAAHYFLVVIATNGCQAEAIDYVDKQSKWHFWTAETLDSHFRTRVRPARGREIIERSFGREIAKTVYGSVHDEALVTANQFFAGTSGITHNTPLVGRQSALEELEAFVAAPYERKVRLLVARGGEGKSRILKAFADRFPLLHPEADLRFVSDRASADAEETSLEFIGTDHPLVVVQDDAHRIETLRPRVLSAIARNPSAKLILAARPQAVEAIRAKLRESGFDADSIEMGEKLPRLTETEMRELAEQVLSGHPAQAFAGTLAEWSDRCPLIVVLGGKLIKDGLDFQSFVDHEDFRALVFRRFEDENLARLAEDDPRCREELKRLLRTVAVLAPFPDSRESMQSLARFMELRGSVLEDRLSRLEAAELVIRTRTGLRVSPDLFADHLVYTSCVRNGQAALFVDELLDLFGQDHWAALLRNLAEAQWHGRSSGAEELDLTGPLWTQFLERFEKSYHWERERMLEAWAGFAVFLPEESIKLTRFVIDHPDAPEAEDPFMRDGWGKSVNSHQRVLQRLPGILESIATYHRKHQWDALDLLARLGKDWKKIQDVDRRETDHPWVVIGKVGAFSTGKCIRVTDELLDWVSDRTELPENDDLVNRRSEFFALALAGLFARSFSQSWFEDHIVTFQSCLVPVEQTRSLRDRTFDFIETSLVTRSEVAALNILPVLDEALERIVEAYRFDDDQTIAEIHKEWREPRQRAVELLQFIAERWPKSEFIQFAVFRLLRKDLHWEADPVIAAARRAAIAMLRRGRAFDLARITLGSQDHSLLDQERSEARSAWDIVRAEWRSMAERWVSESLRRYPSVRDLIGDLQEFESKARARGYAPNWGPILLCLAEQAPDAVQELIEELPRSSLGFLDAHFTVLIRGMRPTPQQEDQWLAAGLKSSRSVIYEAALWDWPIGPEPPGPETLAVLLPLLSDRNISSKKANAAIAALSRAIECPDGWGWSYLDILPVERLSDQSVATLVTMLGDTVEGGADRIMTATVSRILKRMTLLPDLSDSPYPLFLYGAAQHDPREVYEFFVERIRRFEMLRIEGHDVGYQPIMHHLHERVAFGKLRESPDFAGIARFILQQCRTNPYELRGWWEILFKAVVVPSDAGIDLLNGWLTETTVPGEIERIVNLIRFDGATIVFRYPEFIRQVLQKIRRFESEFRVRMESLLSQSSDSRSYKNGELKEPHGYFLHEAQAAVARHAADPILRPFYESVVNAELADRQSHREWYRKRMLDVA